MNIVVPDWLKRVAIYAAVALVLFGTGYIKGCTDKGAEFTRFKADVAAAGKAQNDAAKKQAALDKADKEKRDADYKRSVARLERDLERLRGSARRSVVPPAPAETRDPARAAFDRAELDRALREFTGGVAELVGEGAKAVEGLDSLK